MYTLFLYLHGHLKFISHFFELVKMSEKKLQFRYLMLYQFLKGNNAAKATKEICDICGDKTVNVRTVQKWYNKFRNQDFTLRDEERSGRPTQVHDDQVLTLIQNNPRYTLREIAEILKVSKSTILVHLEKLGFVNRCDVWVPNNLTEQNIMDRVNACVSFLERNERAPFLERLVTGDEKWIVFNKIPRKKNKKPGDVQVKIPKVCSQQKKVILCVWWDYKGIIYYEILSNNETVNSDKYCRQLDRLRLAISEKRPRLSNPKDIVFHQSNSGPLVPLQTQQKLKELGWDILNHPPFSPDLSPSDFHLFRSLQNSLNCKNFTRLDVLENHIKHFFDSKGEEFYRDGIFTLPGKWQAVVSQNGAYV